MKPIKSPTEEHSKGLSSKLNKYFAAFRFSIFEFWKDQEVETGEVIQKSEPEDIIQTIYYV